MSRTGDHSTTDYFLVSGVALKNYILKTNKISLTLSLTYLEILCKTLAKLFINIMIKYHRQFHPYKRVDT